MLHLRIGSLSGIEGRSLRDIFKASGLKKARAKISRAPQKVTLEDWISSADKSTLSIIGFDAPAFAAAAAMEAGQDPVPALGQWIDDARLVLRELDKNPTSILLVSVCGAYENSAHFRDILAARTELDLKPAKPRANPWSRSVLFLDAAQHIVETDPVAGGLFDDLCASALLDGAYQATGEDILSSFGQRLAAEDHQKAQLAALTNLAGQLASSEASSEDVQEALSAFEADKDTGVAEVVSKLADIAARIEALNAGTGNALVKVGASDQPLLQVNALISDALDAAVADIERVEQERNLLQDSLVACSLDSHRQGASSFAVSNSAPTVVELQHADTSSPMHAGRSGVALEADKPVGSSRSGWILRTRDYLLVRQSKLFDPAWYVEYYPDLAGVKNPAMHFILHGAAEGRAASRFFSCRGYTDAYPDVLAGGSNPLVHYLLVGRKEGRRMFPVTDSRGRGV